MSGHSCRFECPNTPGLLKVGPWARLPGFGALASLSLSASGDVKSRAIAHEHLCYLGGDG